MHIGFESRKVVGLVIGKQAQILNSGGIRSISIGNNNFIKKKIL